MARLSPTLQPIKWQVQEIRKQFPGLQQVVYGNKPLVYLDNAATTHKPQVVLDELIYHYQYSNANVHRAIHVLADRATEALEETRKSVQHFINAREPEEIIFTSGTTASINLVASSYGQNLIQAGDEIIISHMEHHANMVPWQMLCQTKGASLKVIPVDDRGELIMPAFEELLGPKTKLVAITYVSNNLGTINPIQEIVTKAHAIGAIVAIDAAQAVPHIPIDVQTLNCDFLAFSAHKAYGPTGVGILYGKRDLLESMPPYQGGGEMIKEVTLAKSTYNDIPYKFEAGTPNIASIVAFRSALEFIQHMGWEDIISYETYLTHYTQGLLNQLDKIQIIGNIPNKIGIIAFIVDGMHHLDIGLLLDAQGIAVRTGHGCAQPLIQRLGLDGIIRVSLAMYNTVEEIDYLVATLTKLIHKN